MPDADVLTRPALELAAMVRSGEITARELAELSVRRIEERDGALHAFIDVDGERALADADAVGADDPRPFAGVPIAIKNNRAVEGRRLTYACELLGDHIAAADHGVTRRLRAAGFVIVGTTNLPEYGILPVSEPRRFPATRNPWDPGRTPGGSSGGAAAAVAAGMLAIAHGNDGGGSIRIPAACCGLVGLKPSRGRVSMAPDLGDHALTQDGVLTRTVADTAAALDVLAGYELGDATWAPPPERTFAEAAAQGLGPGPPRLRIAVAVDPPVGDAVVDPLHLAVVAETAALLEELGHEVVEITPAWSDPEFTTGVALSVGWSAMVAGRMPEASDMQGVSWASFVRARDTSALENMAAHVRLQRMMRTVVAELEPFDAVLTPALGERPLEIGALDADAEDPWETLRAAGRFTPFTAGVNASGQPAISLPIAHGEDGLPIAVQLIGRPARDDVLLSLGAQLEAARPWASRLAPGV